MRIVSCLRYISSSFTICRDESNLWWHLLCSPPYGISDKKTSQAYGFGTHNAIINICLVSPQLDECVYEGEGRRAGSWGGEDTCAGASALMVAPLSASPQRWWEGAPAPQALLQVPRGMCCDPHFYHRTHHCHGHRRQEKGKGRTFHSTECLALEHTAPHTLRAHGPTQLGQAWSSPPLQGSWSLWHSQNTWGSPVRELLLCRVVLIISVCSGRAGDGCCTQRKGEGEVCRAAPTMQGVKSALCNKEITVVRINCRFRARESHWVIHIW